MRFRCPEILLHYIINKIDQNGNRVDKAQKIRYLFKTKKYGMGFCCNGEPRKVLSHYFDINIFL